MSADNHPIAQDFSEETAEQLLSIVKQYMVVAEVEQVSQAIQLAQEACGGVRDHSKASLQILCQISPLEHALAVATILAQMRFDTVGVAVGVIFEAVDANLLSLERVESTLGTPVRRIVSSMLQLNILERKKHVGTQYIAPARGEEENSRDQNKRRIHETLRHQQAEMVRKMFIGMAKDPHVVLLKLIYRLHAMRMVSQHIRQSSPPFDQQEMLAVAQETREVYAPLAGRLSMSYVESELDDLAFAILEPEEYAWVLSHVETENKQWCFYIERVCALLREEMAAIGLEAKVSGRVKPLYSFYKKLKRNAGEDNRLEDLQAALAVDQIHDLVAFRLLVESTSDCYLALGHVHSLWEPKRERIKDFIANPKPNGYRSLHTTVFCMNDRLVEIQIRTFEMHEMAEYGMAMHWHYKDVRNHVWTSAKELSFWLRQLADWQHDR